MEFRGTSRQKKKENKNLALDVGKSVVSKLEQERWINGLRKFERFRMSHG